VQATNNTVGTSNGTSFACPNMAGLGTCLWQGFPEFNNMRIIRALKEAGSIFATPNDRIGYGIPDMKAAFTTLLVEYAASNATISTCTVTLNWNSKDVAAMKYEIERKTPADISYIKIADVTPQAGNVLANHSYQFNNTLTNVAAGTISYRIKQIVDTATATLTTAYIDTASVVLASACVDPVVSGEIFKVQPTPATGDAKLIVQTNDAIANMPITIHDMKGRLVVRLKESKGAGKVIIDLPVNKLAGGKYIVTVYNNQKAIGTTELLRL
jgi:serine protease AprX